MLWLVGILVFDLRASENFSFCLVGVRYGRYRQGFVGAAVWVYTIYGEYARVCLCVRGGVNPIPNLLWLSVCVCVRVCGAEVRVTIYPTAQQHSPGRWGS